MEWGEYLGGFVVFASMAGGVGAGAVIICRRRLPHLLGVTRALALALVITLGLLAVHLLPGALGLLGRGSVLLCTALWVLGALLVKPVEDRPGPAASPPASGRVAELLGAGCVLSVVAGALALGSDQIFLAPGSIDILNFHLPGIASWIQDGSIWGVHEFVADVSPGRYPNNGDVVLLAAILPWHSDFLSHLVPYAYYLLCGLATYALALELGASRAAGATAGALLAAMPIVALPALVNSFPDVIMLFGLAVGVLFLLRHRRTAATADLVLAGLALGLAFGTKWYGVSAVAVVLVVWAAGSRVDGRPWRTLARQGSALLALTALAGGIWMLRNWIQSGNPVHPVEVSVFGLTIFSAPADVVRELIGFTIAGYAGDWGAWTEHILPQYRQAFAFVGPLLLVGLAFAVVALVSRLRASLERGVLVAVLVAALLIGATYAITPYTAGGLEGEPTLVYVGARYLVPAILLALALIAAVTRAAPWAAAVFAALGLVAIWDGIDLAGAGELSGAKVGASDWAVAIALVAAAAAIVAAMRNGSSRRPGRVAATAAAAIAIVGLVAGGFELQRRFLDHRYAGIDPTTDWIREHAPADASVGVAGRWTTSFSPVLPSFGPRFENRVFYVGELVDGTLRPYRDRAGFIAALRERDPDLLVVGRGYDPRPDQPERIWAKAAGFELIVESPGLALYRAPDRA